MPETNIKHSSLPGGTRMGAALGGCQGILAPQKTETTVLIQ